MSEWCYKQACHINTGAFLTSVGFTWIYHTFDPTFFQIISSKIPPSNHIKVTSSSLRFRAALEFELPSEVGIGFLAIPSELAMLLLEPFFLLQQPSHFKGHSVWTCTHMFCC